MPAVVIFNWQMGVCKWTDSDNSVFDSWTVRRAISFVRPSSSSLRTMRHFSQKSSWTGSIYVHLVCWSSSHLNVLHLTSLCSILLPEAMWWSTRHIWTHAQKFSGWEKFKSLTQLTSGSCSAPYSNLVWGSLLAESSLYRLMWISGHSAHPHSIHTEEARVSA